MKKSYRFNLGAWYRRSVSYLFDLYILIRILNFENTYLQISIFGLANIVDRICDEILPQCRIFVGHRLESRFPIGQPTCTSARPKVALDRILPAWRARLKKYEKRIHPSHARRDDRALAAFQLAASNSDLTQGSRFCSIAFKWQCGPPEEF
jgi:hypothetical protein